MDIPCTQPLLDELDDEEIVEESEKAKIGLLIVEEFKQLGISRTEYPVFEGDNIIGRHENCHISIPLAVTMSKKHSCIEAEKSGCYIYDCGSSNKTKLGNLRLKPEVRYCLQDGDTITFANIKCSYKQIIDQSPSTTPILSPSHLLAVDTPDTTIKSSLQTKLNESYLKEIPDSQTGKSESDIDQTTNLENPQIDFKTKNKDEDKENQQVNGCWINTNNETDLETSSNIVHVTSSSSDSDETDVDDEVLALHRESSIKSIAETPRNSLSNYTEHVECIPDSCVKETKLSVVSANDNASDDEYSLLPPITNQVIVPDENVKSINTTVSSGINCPLQPPNAQTEVDEENDENVSCETTSNTSLLIESKVDREVVDMKNEDQSNMVDCEVVDMKNEDQSNMVDCEVVDMKNEDQSNMVDREVVDMKNEDQSNMVDCEVVDMKNEDQSNMVDCEVVDMKNEDQSNMVDCEVVDMKNEDQSNMVDLTFVHDGRNEDKSTSVEICEEVIHNVIESNESRNKESIMTNAASDQDDLKVNSSLAVSNHVLDLNQSKLSPEKIVSETTTKSISEQTGINKQKKSELSLNELSCTSEVHIQSVDSSPASISSPPKVDSAGDGSAQDSENNFPKPAVTVESLNDENNSEQIVNNDKNRPVDKVHESSLSVLDTDTKNLYSEKPDSSIAEESYKTDADLNQDNRNQITSQQQASFQADTEVNNKKIESDSCKNVEDSKLTSSDEAEIKQNHSESILSSIDVISNPNLSIYNMVLPDSYVDDIESDDDIFRPSPASDVGNNEYASAETQPCFDEFLDDPAQQPLTLDLSVIDEKPESFSTPSQKHTPLSSRESPTTDTSPPNSSVPPNNCASTHVSPNTSNNDTSASVSPAPRKNRSPKFLTSSNRSRSKMSTRPKRKGRGQNSRLSSDLYELGDATKSCDTSTTTSEEQSKTDQTKKRVGKKSDDKSMISDVTASRKPSTRKRKILNSTVNPRDQNNQIDDLDASRNVSDLASETAKKRLRSKSIASNLNKTVTKEAQSDVKIVTDESESQIRSRASKRLKAKLETAGSNRVDASVADVVLSRSTRRSVKSRNSQEDKENKVKINSTTQLTDVSSKKLNTKKKISYSNINQSEVETISKRRKVSLPKASENEKIKEHKLDANLIHSSALSLRPRRGKPKVMFTGVIDKVGESIVKELGGHLTDDMHECTHLVTDKMRRTVKFLCAVVRGLIIVNQEWLRQSKLNKKFINEDEFELSDDSLSQSSISSLSDTLHLESLYDFKLSESLITARNRTRGLFDGYRIHVTKSVLPPPDQMYQIIECGGGKGVARLPRGSKLKDLIVVSTDEDKYLCSDVIKSGLPVVNKEFILTGILQQKLNLSKNRIFLDKQNNANNNNKQKTPTSIHNPPTAMSTRSKSTRRSSRNKR